MDKWPSLNESPRQFLHDYDVAWVSRKPCKCGLAHDTGVYSHGYTLTCTDFMCGDPKRNRTDPEQVAIMKSQGMI